MDRDEHRSVEPEIGPARNVIELRARRNDGGADPRTSSGPAATRAAHTGRTHDRTQIGLPIRRFPLHRRGRPHMTRRRNGVDYLSSQIVARSWLTKWLGLIFQPLT